MQRSQPNTKVSQFIRNFMSAKDSDWVRFEDKVNKFNKAIKGGADKPTHPSSRYIPPRSHNALGNGITRQLY